MSQKTLLAMVLSVLGITACHLPSTRAIATALEGRPATVTRLRRHTLPGLGRRRAVRQGSRPGGPRMTRSRSAARRPPRRSPTATLRADIRLNQSSTDDQAITHQEEDRQIVGRNARPARLRATRSMRCRSSRTALGPYEKPVQDPRSHHSVHVDDAVAGTDSLSAAHKAQHIKPARSKDEMFS